MTTMVRPESGGFIRPFGCGWFIREFLLGHGPEGSPQIDPERGAPQAEIKFHYKEAIYRSVARDRAEKEISDLVQAGVDVTTDMASEIEQKHYSRIPSKTTGMRYHSFTRYFHLLKQLKWVERTGEEEKSSPQEQYPPAPPRRYYRLTAKGRKATEMAWANPFITLYGDSFPPEYFREKRKAKRYG